MTGATFLSHLSPDTLTCPLAVCSLGKEHSGKITQDEIAVLLWT